jgi:hypothetical protein
MRAYRDNMRALAEDDSSVPSLDTVKRLGRQNRIVVGTGADDGLYKLQVYGTEVIYGNPTSSLEIIGNGLLQTSIVSDDPNARLNLRGYKGTGCGFSLDLTDTGGTFQQRMAVSNAGAVLFPVSVDSAAFGTTGTFTPSLVGTGGGSAHTYVTRQGYYRKMGKTVHFTTRVQLSAKDATMSGTISISGLPFAPIGTHFWGTSLGYYSGYTKAVANVQLLGLVSPGSAAVFLYEQAVQTLAAAIGAAFDIMLSGTYETT